MYNIFNTEDWAILVWDCDEELAHDASIYNFDDETLAELDEA